MRTRRALLGSALAALLVAPATARAAAVQRRAAAVEVRVLRDLIHAEDAAAEAYALAAQATGDPLLARVRDHDRLHAVALRAQIEALTVSVALSPPGSAARDPDAAPLAAARGLAAARRAAVVHEQARVAALDAAIGVLTDDGLLQTVASVMAAHAQQLAAVRLAAGRAPLGTGAA
jgi:hypothetical protein